MRLVSPSVGECADRMTILELKVTTGKQRGIDVTHFEEEYAAIRQYLGVDGISIVVKKEYIELQHVNHGLWDLEGNVRRKSEWRKHPDLAVEILDQITYLNDKRAELVNALDGKTIAQEKMY